MVEEVVDDEGEGGEKEGHKTEPSPRDEEGINGELKCYANGRFLLSHENLFRRRH